MTENEFILEDRLAVIRDTVQLIGEEHCYVSLSGGKDSTVVHHLVDMAMPTNKVKRVYSDTGIEYRAVSEFVKELAKEDERIEIIHPKRNIKKTLETEGYPFKSKQHSKYVDIYQRLGMTKSVKEYAEQKHDYSAYNCPTVLQYQFSDEFKLRVSDKCCDFLKKEPIHDWEKGKDIRCKILGLMASEGGRRESVQCKTTYSWGISFSPLAKITSEWEQWFIDTYNIKLCKLYHPPYNFERTGCKGCPYNLNLETDLETMRTLMPAEEKQCWVLFRPFYEEYQRIGYRLKKNTQTHLNL